MRKIEQQMCAAIQNEKDWQSDNTSVHFNAEEGVSVVRLHGNKIAEVGYDFTRIFDGGWQTTTTKSRINAICETFGYKGEGVFQKDFKWFVRRHFVRTDDWVTDDFVNGYTFAD